MQSASYYRGKEQTYLKHFFFEKYLETLAFHIGFAYKEFVYVDCFSGPWRANDEQLADTSIRISLDRLNYVLQGLAAQQRHPTIRAIFVEKDPAAFAALTQALNDHSGAIKTKAFLGTFEENIPQILQEVGTAFAFFFIDPKGWKGFAMDNIQPILRHHPGEVMVNFMYDFINRFLTVRGKANEDSLDRFFGTPRWRDISDTPDREEASVKLYEEQLRATGGFTYVTGTRILKPTDNRTYFHLIYGTRNPKGIIEFRNVERKATLAQDDVRDDAKRERREQRTGQGELSFAPPDTLAAATQTHREFQLKKAAERLDTILQQGPIRYETLQPLILELRLVWYTDLNKLLLEGQKNGILVIEGLRPQQRTPSHGCTIRLITP